MFGMEYARTIERLREAAAEHGEVAKLIWCLTRVISFTPNGVVSLHCGDDDAEYLRAASAARAFIDLDRSEPGK